MRFQKVKTESEVVLTGEITASFQVVDSKVEAVELRDTEGHVYRITQDGTYSQNLAVARQEDKVVVSHVFVRGSTCDGLVEVDKAFGPTGCDVDAAARDYCNSLLASGADVSVVYKDELMYSDKIN